MEIAEEVCGLDSDAQEVPGAEERDELGFSVGGDEKEGLFEKDVEGFFGY